MLLYDKAQRLFLKCLTEDLNGEGFTHYRKLMHEYKTSFDVSMPSIFQPVVVSPETGSAMKIQSEHMAAILNKCTDIYLKHNEVRRFFGFPDELNDMIMHYPGYDTPVPVSRYDGLWNGEYFQFCEFNTDGSSGMNDTDFLSEKFLQTNIGKIMQQEHGLKIFNVKENLLNTILDTYKKFGGKGKPCIAITDFMESATKYEFTALKNHFINSGFKTEICEIRNLRLKSDGLWHNDFRIDIVYRRAVTDEIYSKRNDIPEFFKAYYSNAACVVGPLRSQVAHSKLLLAFLHSDLMKKYFTAEEKEFISRHVPWTARINGNDRNLCEYVLENREELFVKPHDSRASKGVICGISTSSEKWRELLEKEVFPNNNYLVQKRIKNKPESFIFKTGGKTGMYYVNLGPYLFNGKFSGMYIRADKGMISKNSIEQPFFIATR